MPSTPRTVPEAPDRASERAGARGATWALVVGGILLVASFAVPALLAWDVATRAARSADPRALAPLHGVWVPHLGWATPAALLVAVLAWRYAPTLAERLRWGPLLALSFVAGLGWLLVLALVDGPNGLSRVLGNPYEYLQTARAVEDVGALLREYVSRIPIDAPQNWVTHVAGHPPGMLLFFIALVRIGWGADLVAGVVVTVIAATIPAAVFTTLRRLGAEKVARRSAPFLVFTPAAVFLAVSADAVIAAVGAWGIAALATAATARRVTSGVAATLAAGLLLGTLVELSYGMVLMGVLAVAVLVAAGRPRVWWSVFPSVAAVALAVVLAFAAAGFAWWEALPVLSERYRDGIAARRPYGYWVWGNLGALLVAAGPMLAAAVGAAAARWRQVGRVLLLLAGAGVAMIALADVSGMSKAEVERIWLPFIPWVTISFAALPERWRRPALAVQLASALLVQHLFYTVW